MSRATIDENETKYNIVYRQEMEKNQTLKMLYPAESMEKEHKVIE